MEGRHETNFTKPDMAHLILYDSVCGLCNRLDQLVLRHDHKGEFKFLSLQSPKAVEQLTQHHRDPAALDTLLVVTDSGHPTESLLDCHEAILFICSRLGGRWKLISWARVLPAWLLRLLYNLVARFRYVLFGKLDSCPLPDPSYRDRFLD
jgi:predicted DCC family thiol-disulfide oxidoreductase YuxK